MSSLKIITNKGKESGSVNLPVQFSEPFRPDLILRSVLASQSRRRQKYGPSPEAGKRHSAILSKRRRKYRGTYGRGRSRVPRKVMMRRGMFFQYVGAFAPGTVGGRRAHPPKVEKNFVQKINKKENRKAIRSALSAAVNRELVLKRGHLVPENYPFVIGSDWEKIDKTKDVVKLLEQLGFDEELKRSSVKKVRAGKGKMRGRKYKKKKGILFVVSRECPLMRAVNSIQGVESVLANNVGAENLAPGGVAGRCTLITAAVVSLFDKEGLFI